MSEQFQGMDAMMQAFIHKNEDEKLIVLAEDIERENSGIDYSQIFFEPQVGKSYTIKFIQNPFGPNITHRKVYKDLPDPKRKGKNFFYTSSGSAKTCKALELFFELHKLKKEGNGLATKKIDEFLGVKNQGCVLIQIHASENPEEIGLIRLFQFSTFGPNPIIANMLNSISNPTEAQIREGEVKEDVFDIFNSTAMVLQCEEVTFEEGIKGRDFAKSSWSKKKRGVFVTYEKDGQTIRYEFNENDKLSTPEAKEAFKHLIDKLNDDKLSVHNYFAYKEIGDSKNSEDTEKYLKEVNEKINEIIPIIRDAKSIADIKNYGINETPNESTNDSAQLIGGATKQDILKNSIPNELSNSILNNQSKNVDSEENTQPVMQPSKNVLDILGGND